MTGREETASVFGATEHTAGQTGDVGSRVHAPEPWIGVGLRRRHFSEVLKTDRRIDGLEFVPENFADFGGRAPAVLEACRERWPLRAHGVASNLGGRDPLNRSWSKRLKTCLDGLEAPCFSDHACFTADEGVSSLDLLPLPFTVASAEYLGSRAKAWAQHLERPLLLENITYYARMPGSQLREGAWLAHVLEVSGAGLLLDVNNLYVNARNHGEDPIRALDEMPLERVERIHLAGHAHRGDLLVDDHGGPVADAVMNLYEEVLRRCGPIETILEWDNRVPPLDILLDEADRIRARAQVTLARSSGYPRSNGDRCGSCTSSLL